MVVLKLTFLGTGTSHGVPVLTCKCAVCTSLNTKNKRTRSSLLVEHEDINILIDTATEFRIQALRANITKVDAVLYTHCHADHVFGFDDLRVFSKLTNKSIPIYGNEPTITEFKEVFAYLFRQTQKGGGKSQVEPLIVSEPFELGGLHIQPIPALHGRLPIFGYRLGNMAYLTDCSYIPDSSRELLRDLEVLILGVVHHDPNPSHLNVGQALDLVEELKPKKTYFTHISHLLEHDETNALLPSAVNLAYDGLKVSL